MFERNRIAEMLRSAREKRGLSLEQAATQAGVPTQYLRLLEGESNVRIGVSDELYLVPFFRKYARFVGIDAEEMLPEFLGVVQQLPGEGSPPIRLTYRPRHAFLWRPLAVLATIAVATFLLLRQTHERPAFDDAAAPISDAPSSAVISQPTSTLLPAVTPIAGALPEATRSDAAASAAPTEKTPSATPTLAPTGGHVLTITANEDAWLALASDDQASRQYLLRAGESRTWTAERFSLTVGNAGGISLSLDGRELPAVGRTGQVVRNLHLPAVPPSPNPSGQ